MNAARFRTIANFNPDLLQSILTADPRHPQIHFVDMPYRLASTWQDQDCEMGIWEVGETVLAWALFQPAWWNLDFAIHPKERGSSLTSEVFEWGKGQMNHFAERTGENFYGSVEFFEDVPEVELTKRCLERLGFGQFSWNTKRLRIDLPHPLPSPRLQEGFKIRPLGGLSEVESYVQVHRATFNSNKMTTAWRRRTLEGNTYRPEIDLVVVGPADNLAGFCTGWLWGEFGQIEPIGIHPDYQGMGLGKALEIASVNAMWNLGARQVFIDHVSTNEKAILNSQAIGFKQVNTALRYYVEVKPRG